MIQKYFSYTGRLNRLRYFLRILVVMILASILGTLLVQVSEYLAYIVSFIASISAIMLGIRRCHDLDRSGWFYLLIYPHHRLLRGPVLAVCGRDPWSEPVWRRSLGQPVCRLIKKLPASQSFFMDGICFCIIHISTPLAP